MDEAIKGKRVLVTGSAGVIGLELLTRLIESGAEILSVDRYPLPEKQNRSVTHLQRDIAAAPLFEMHDFKPEIIFHLAAAFERARETSEFWRVNWHDNVLLSHHVVDQAKDITALETFIFASSYLIYSPSLYLFEILPKEVTRLREDSSVDPRNITGAAKYYTERELEFVREYSNSSLRVINARIFRVYGLGSNDVISRWIRAALSGQTIEVYNKSNRFDFIHAGDVAEGLLRCASKPKAEGIVNLGSGVPHSIKDILSILLAHFLDLKVRDTGASDAYEASCADLTRLQQYTNWRPMTDIEEGIKMVVDFEECKSRGS
jgi:nucleoside-diphosphate-sugar epimerase